jgi:hypothetical protein
MELPHGRRDGRDILLVVLKWGTAQMTKLVAIIDAIIDIIIGIWSIPREYPIENEKQHTDKYEMPEMDAVSSSWMEARKLDMYDSSLRKNQSGHPSNAILAGVLGAITPQAIMFIVLVFGNFLISKHTGELISYMWLFTCLPAVFLGFVIGGKPPASLHMR